MNAYHFHGRTLESANTNMFFMKHYYNFTLTLNVPSLPCLDTAESYIFKSADVKLCGSCKFLWFSRTIQNMYVLG